MGYGLRACHIGDNGDGPQYGLSREPLINAIEFSKESIINFVTEMVNHISRDKIYDFLTKIIEMKDEHIIAITEEEDQVIHSFLYELELCGT